MGCTGSSNALRERMQSGSGHDRAAVCSLEKGPDSYLDPPSTTVTAFCLYPFLLFHAAIHELMKSPESFESDSSTVRGKQKVIYDHLQ